MTVLKSNQVQPLLKEAIVLDLGDLTRQAAKLRAQAEARAAQIIEQAEQEAARLVAQAESKGFEQGQTAGYEQGYEQGRAEGRQQALDQATEQFQQLQQAWRDVVTQWDVHRSELESQAKQSVIAFALRMTETLLNRVIELDETVVVDQVAGALAYVLRPLDVTVRINPADRPVLEEAMPQLLAEFTNLTHIQLADDDNIGRGGCVLTYGQGQIDATLDTQLQRIIELILPDQLEQDTLPATATEARDDADTAQASGDAPRQVTINEPDGLEALRGMEGVEIRDMAEDEDMRK